MTHAPAAVPLDAAPARLDAAIRFQVVRTSPDWFTLDVGAEGSSETVGGVASPPLGDELAKILATVPVDARALSLPPGDPPRFRVRLDGLGEKLSAALFSDGARALLERATAGLAPDQGLRLVLWLEGDDDLALGIPWELAHRPGGRDLLAAHPRTPMLREIRIDRSDTRAQPAGPLRILAVLSSPSGCEPIDFTRERRDLDAMSAALHGKVAIEVLEQPTRDALRERLARGVHVVHFTGCAKRDGLCLHGADGRADIADGRSLAAIFDAGAPWLAVVRARGAAPQLPVRLLQAGFGAVVTMQHAMSEAGAQAFDAALYGALAREVPLPSAVALGRRALSESVEVGVPALYVRENRRAHAAG